VNPTVPFSAFFLNTEGRALFSVFYPAQDVEFPKGFILHIPAFAEEMNKSRRMVALQAQAFAKSGYAVLVVDLYGTGDSTGDFSDATWMLWKQDITAACLWLIEQGASAITLWGLRMGALLAMDFASYTVLKINHVLCWQPVLNGELFVMQFLRLRLATAMMDNNAPQEKTADLKQQLLDGQIVEVAGYALPPDLITPLLALSAHQIDTGNLERISFIEVVGNSDKPMSANLIKFVEQQQNKDRPIILQTVVGSPFWATQEIAEVPELLIESINCLILPFTNAHRNSACFSMP
jgi:exosortase A-associated hydrolase 2